MNSQDNEWHGVQTITSGNREPTDWIGVKSLTTYQDKSLTTAIAQDREQEDDEDQLPVPDLTDTIDTRIEEWIADPRKYEASKLVDGTVLMTAVRGVFDGTKKWFEDQRKGWELSTAVRIGKSLDTTVDKRVQAHSEDYDAKLNEVEEHVNSIFQKMREFIEELEKRQDEREERHQQEIIELKQQMTELRNQPIQVNPKFKMTVDAPLHLAAKVYVPEESITHHVTVAHRPLRKVVKSIVYDPVSGRPSRVEEEEQDQQEEESET